MKNLQLRRTLTPGDGSSRLGLALLALALFGVFSLQFGHNWYAGSNILATGLSMSSIAIAVTGTAALLISGNVDLSIGGMYALTACTAATVAKDTYSTPLTILVALGCGAVLGGFNGVLVRLLKLSPLIVTIATMALYSGLAFVVSQGITIGNFPPSFVKIGQSSLWGVQVPVIVAAVIFVVGSLLLVSTRTGLRLYAIGGNERSAALSGIPVARTVIGLYAVNGMLIGVVALLASARLGSAAATLGANFEFDVLTAAILGGVAFAGGAGRPLGVLFGVAMIGILNAGLLFEGLQQWWQEIAQGGLLLVALSADQALQRWRGRARDWGVVAATQDSDGAVALTGTGGAGDVDALVSAELEYRRRADHAVIRPDAAVVLQAKDMTKQFGPSTGVRGVDLTVRAGEILFLVGDNGAGKSTLIKMLSGALHPDRGELVLNGATVQFDSPREARQAGVQTVYQDLAVCANLSVAHNMVLGTEPTRRIAGVLRVRDDQRAEQVAAERLEGLGVHLPDYRASLNNLSGGQRQSVAIARAMDPDAHLVILDEPTAALGVTQTDSVLDLVTSVAAAGAAVILITHDVETVLDVGHRVVVLRLGTVIHDGPVDQLDDVALIRLMSGRGKTPVVQR